MLDPDEQVQAVVQLVFGLFEQLGTVHAVLGFLVGHQVQIGVRDWPGQGRGGLAPPAPDRDPEHAAQPGLRWNLRLRAQPV
jgi:hypothetical protein